MDPRFTKEQKSAILEAIVRVALRFAMERNGNETGAQAFNSIFDGGINFSYKNDDNSASGQCKDSKINSGGCTSSSSQINFWSMAGESNNNMFTMIGNVVHELGHAYNSQLQKGPEGDMPWRLVENRYLILEPNSRAPIPNACDECPYWQYHRSLDSSETFADMFVAWIYNQWNSDPRYEERVRDAQSWMDVWTP